MSLVRILLILIVCATTPPAQAKPNILIILTDDQGWGDLSASGNSHLATPNIDSLARDGATLDSFYVCAVCAPTRAEFLTGRYYPRTGVSGVTRGEGRLNPDETTIADVFKSEGYATGAFGKWHNGTQPPYHPNDRGFDEYYGFTSGHWSHYFDVPMDHNGERVRGEGFIVDDVTNKAVAFIEREAAAENPFFCYVPYNTPHSPMMIPDRWFQKFENFEPTLRHRDPDKEDLAMTRSALALCENIDWNVGRLLKALKSSGVANDTIVLFFSDNGPNSYRWNADMKGRKGSIDEGGVRSPFFIRWPNQIAPNTRIPQIAGAIDLLPTLTDLADVPLTPSPTKPIDGQSLRPLLIPQSTNAKWPERELYSVRRDEVSVRTQRFRLDAEGRLFDIPNDPGQRTDVAKDHPESAARLAELAKNHGEKMLAAFQANADRPFTVGFGETTQLPVRDAIAHGSIERSSKAPNNSFLHAWTNPDDYITWDIEVGEYGDYEAILYYTCAPENVGCELELSFQRGGSLRATIVEAFDPPLYDKGRERVENSHYFMKDFTPTSLGTIPLTKGRGLLKLSAAKMTGSEMVDVHSLILKKRDPKKD
ncbi:MAG: arylsulfatase [Verrucomicrobiota bacterium]